jgi:hypothetical protein
VPTRFLTDEQIVQFGRFAAVPPDQATLERFFFLDDADRDLVAKRRGDHNRLGFALQLATVRWLGTFLTDPLDVPLVVLDFVAAQVEVADPSCVKRYTEREKTRLEHQWEIAQVGGFVSFASAQEQLVEWLDRRAWTTGDGPKALFVAVVGWLRERRVLLPGVTPLVELVAEVRQAAETRLFAQLAGAVTADQAQALESVLRVPEGQRRSQLDLWRRGERSTSGRGMVAALTRVASIAGLGMRRVDVAGVPTRRVIELARYGMAAKAPKLARHPYRRRLATLLATVRWLEVTATDDALELFDVFMTNELIGRASNASDKEKLRRQPGYARHAAVLRAAVQVLLESDEWGEGVPVEVLWDAIETAVGSRDRLRAAVDGVAAMIPPAGADPDGQWRAAVVERFATVRPFLRMLCEVIEFGATADAQRVLDAMRALPQILDTRPSERIPKGYADARKVYVDLVPGGWWQRLVFPKGRPEGTVDRNAYVFCVLELFHTGLKHRDIFAAASDRWSDPRARLLTGERWAEAKDAALGALQLPDDPEELLAGHAADLDAAWRSVGGGIVPDGPVSIDAEGRDEQLADRHCRSIDVVRHHHSHRLPTVVDVSAAAGVWRARRAARHPATARKS